MSENFDSPIEIGFCGAKPVEEPIELPIRLPSLDYTDADYERIADTVGLYETAAPVLAMLNCRERQLQASLQRERRLRSDLEAMTVDRDLWAYDHNEDCPNAARAEAAEGRVAVLEKLLLQYKVAQPISEWHEDLGACLWWFFPMCEPPYAGDPLCDDWPEYHTHFTRLTNDMLPAPPTT